MTRPAPTPRPSCSTPEGRSRRTPPRRSRPAPRRGRARFVVRRLLLCAALLVPSLLLGLATRSGAMQPEPPPPSVTATTRAATGCAHTDFTRSMRCWGNAAAGGERSIVVTVSAPQSLGGEPGLDAVADAVEKLRDKLVVIVPDGVGTGSGGTLLLALASHRIVGEHSSISPLSVSEHRRLTELNGCPPDRFCDTVRSVTRSGGDLVRRGLAQDARTSLFTAGPARSTAPADSGANPADGGGAGGVPPTDVEAQDDASGDSFAVLLVIGAVLLCLVTTLGLMVRRTGGATEAAHRRRSPTPSASRREPTSRRRQFTARPGRTARPPETPPGREPTARAPETSARAQRSAPRPESAHPAPHRLPTTVPDTPTAAAGRPTAQQPRVQRAMTPQAVTPRSAELPTMPGPTAAYRSGVVRTVLRPQGYVDVDGLLYRAGWGGPGEPPPPGRPVRVVRDGADGLTAHPAAHDDDLMRTTSD
ncbi:hypothetical protein [Streptomyces sp. NPDC088254]|uniref:hypothetical protein n=1 Tax=Streptomyces sp. NPDC088254 TaxID=3365847 RepID=UPI0037F7872E